MPLNHHPQTQDRLRSVIAARDELVRLAYRFVWNTSDAEDAVQAALLLASQRLDQLESDASVETWVRTIVVRQCMELNRNRRTTTSLDVRSAAPATPIDRRLELNERQRMLSARIQALPERQQAALVLRHLEGLDYPTVARLMEITESTARGLVRNAREALRKMILAQDPHWVED